MIKRPKIVRSSRPVAGKGSVIPRPIAGGASSATWAVWISGEFGRLYIPPYPGSGATPYITAHFDMLYYATSLDGVINYRPRDYPNIDDVVIPYDGIYSFTYDVISIPWARNPNTGQPLDPTYGVVYHALLGDMEYYGERWFPWYYATYETPINYSYVRPMFAGQSITGTRVWNQTNGWIQYGAWPPDLFVEYMCGFGEHHGAWW